MNLNIISPTRPKVLKYGKLQDNTHLDIPPSTHKCYDRLSFRERCVEYCDGSRPQASRLSAFGSVTAGHSCQTTRITNRTSPHSICLDKPKFRIVVMRFEDIVLSENHVPGGA